MLLLQAKSEVSESWSALRIGFKPGNIGCIPGAVYSPIQPEKNLQTSRGGSLWLQQDQALSDPTIKVKRGESARWPSSAYAYKDEQSSRATPNNLDGEQYLLQQ